MYILFDDCYLICFWFYLTFFFLLFYTFFIVGFTSTNCIYPFTFCFTIHNRQKKIFANVAPTIYALRSRCFWGKKNKSSVTTRMPPTMALHPFGDALVSALPDVSLRVPRGEVHLSCLRHYVGRPPRLPQKSRLIPLSDVVPFDGQTVSRPASITAEARDVVANWLRVFRPVNLESPSCLIRILTFVFTYSSHTIYYLIRNFFLFFFFCHDRWLLFER